MRAKGACAGARRQRGTFPVRVAGDKAVQSAAVFGRLSIRPSRRAAMRRLARAKMSFLLLASFLLAQAGCKRIVQEAIKAREKEQGTAAGTQCAPRNDD